MAVRMVVEIGIGLHPTLGLFCCCFEKDKEGSSWLLLVLLVYQFHPQDGLGGRVRTYGLGLIVPTMVPLKDPQPSML